jgi:hypothetical protein
MEVVGPLKLPEAASCFPGEEQKVTPNALRFLFFNIQPTTMHGLIQPSSAAEDGGPTKKSDPDMENSKGW